MSNSSDENVVVIGSGLSAVSVCHALISRGIKPVVLDVGKLLDASRSHVVQRMSLQDPVEWNAHDRSLVTENPSVSQKQFPRKMVFGSDYFYGEPEDNEIACREGVFPPFSQSKGGFSVGWGGAVLRPDDCDISDWPVTNADLDPFYRKALATCPYSARADRLEETFPLISTPGNCLRLSSGNRELLGRLNRSGIYDPEKLTFGQARLMVNADEDTPDSCKYCGCCMSGCVYGAIYKADKTIDQMAEQHLIDYRPGYRVIKLAENRDDIEVLAEKFGEGRVTLKFKRLFLAAGALNSVRIMLESKGLFDYPVEVKTTVGFIAPMIKLKHTPIDWPKTNTMPGIFLEYKVDKLSSHWIHTQISTPNELALSKLGINYGATGLVAGLRRRLAGHLMLALCNLHSDHANHYSVTLRKQSSTGMSSIETFRHSPHVANRAMDLAIGELSKYARKFGCYLVRPGVQRSTSQGSYHIGGGLPMRDEPKEAMDTNPLGVPLGWNRVHVVDSSVFPSLPGTTIGLVAMANAWRIAQSANLE